MIPGDLATDRLTFILPYGGRFQIGSTALTSMQPYVQDAPSKCEAGGVLLGRHILGTKDIIVDGVTVPMQGDRRGRFRFFRARRRHQKAIDHAWQESGGTCTYLGEWHTHPEYYPRPSLIDRIDWGYRLLFDRFTEPIFFVIVGTARIRAWKGRRRGRLTPLQRV